MTWEFIYENKSHVAWYLNRYVTNKQCKRWWWILIFLYFSFLESKIILYFFKNICILEGRKRVALFHARRFSITLTLINNSLLVTFYLSSKCVKLVNKLVLITYNLFIFNVTYKTQNVYIKHNFKYCTTRLHLIYYIPLSNLIQCKLLYHFNLY